MCSGGHHRGGRASERLVACRATAAAEDSAAGVDEPRRAAHGEPFVDREARRCAVRRGASPSVSTASMSTDAESAVAAYSTPHHDHTRSHRTTPQSLCTARGLVQRAALESGCGTRFETASERTNQRCAPRLRSSAQCSSVRAPRIRTSRRLSTDHCSRGHTATVRACLPHSPPLLRFNKLQRPSSFASIASNDASLLCPPRRRQRSVAVAVAVRAVLCGLSASPGACGRQLHQQCFRRL